MEDPIKRRERCKKYYEINKEMISQQHREYYENNKKKILQKQK